MTASMLSAHNTSVVDKDGLRQRKKQRTKRALADAATRLFAERGYDEATISDIAAAADVSPRTFFSYFPSKEDVLFAYTDDRLAGLSELEVRRPGERLLDAARRLTGQIAADPVSEDDEIRWRIVNSRPALQARLLMRVWAADREMAARLHAAFPDEVDEVIAAAVVGAFTSGLRAAVARSQGVPRSAQELQAVVNQLVRLLEHGLAGGRLEGC